MLPASALPARHPYSLLLYQSTYFSAQLPPVPLVRPHASVCSCAFLASLLLPYRCAFSLNALTLGPTPILFLLPSHPIQPTPPSSPLVRPAPYAPPHTLPLSLFHQDGLSRGGALPALHLSLGPGPGPLLPYHLVHLLEPLLRLRPARGRLSARLPQPDPPHLHRPPLLL